MGNGMEQRRGGLGTREGDTSGEQGGIGRLERTDGQSPAERRHHRANERTGDGGAKGRCVGRGRQCDFGAEEYDTLCCEKTD